MVLHDYALYKSTFTLLYYFTKFAVFSASGYRYLGDGDADRREILRGDTYRSRTGLLPFLRAVPQGIPHILNFGLNFGHLTVNISKMVSRSIT